jgi:hypothetical protein
VSKDTFDLGLDDELDTITPRSVDEKPWMIIRHTGFNNRTGYKMREGDLIRLGKSMFRVLETRVKDTGPKTMKQHTVADNLHNNRVSNNNGEDLSGIEGGDGDNYHHTNMENFGQMGVDVIKINRAVNKDTDGLDERKYLSNNIDLRIRMVPFVGFVGQPIMKIVIHY